MGISRNSSKIFERGDERKSFEVTGGYDAVRCVEMRLEILCLMSLPTFNYKSFHDVAKMHG